MFAISAILLRVSLKLITRPTVILLPLNYNLLLFIYPELDVKTLVRISTTPSLFQSRGRECFAPLQGKAVSRITKTDVFARVLSRVVASYLWTVHLLPTLLGTPVHLLLYAVTHQPIMWQQRNSERHAGTGRELQLVLVDGKQRL